MKKTKFKDTMLRSYQPEINIYKEMQEAMDKNWKRLMEEKNETSNK